MDACFRKKVAWLAIRGSLWNGRKLHKPLDATTWRHFVGLDRRDIHAGKRDP